MSSARPILLIALSTGALLGAIAVACGDDSNPAGSDPTNEEDSGVAKEGGSPADDGATPAVDAGADAKRLGLARLYVGSGDGKIRIFSFDSATYAISLVDTVTTSGPPSFLALDPSTRFLYAVDETNDKVNAFTVTDTGTLTPLQTVNSGGDGPAHVSVDRGGRYVMVANYGGGTISIFPRGADGRMGTATTRSFGGTAQTHQIVTDPSDVFAFVPNKGLDLVAVVRLGSSGDGGLYASGDGARHIDFHPNGRFAYVIDELGDTVTAFSLEPSTGALTKIDQQSSLLSGVPSDTNTGAEIQVLAGGKHLIASNRGDDSLMVFDIADNGTITRKTRVPSGGSTPRHFNVEKTGRFLFVGNETSGKVLVMKVDPESGVPSPVGKPLTVPSPKFSALVYLDR
jgi:6-phosphogluconolactonase